MIDYSKFHSSLRRLEQQQDNYLTLDAEHPELIREGIAESVIQRFETCYDCLWKVLKRYLMEELGIAEPPNSPKPIFRLANENGLLPSQVGQWLKYADARTDTSHDYDGEKAKACLNLVPNFIGDAIRLYGTKCRKVFASRSNASISRSQEKPAARRTRGSRRFWWLIVSKVS